ncbi:MAG: hypothetical protein N4A38_01385 [Candidatus Gracilibacteria bacterium]|jgi:hypothetical protein|nr:hypothetical protein [Candidatus Gracilibacteria bacterium]
MIFNVTKFFAIIGVNASIGMGIFSLRELIVRLIKYVNIPILEKTVKFFSYPEGLIIAGCCVGFWFAVQYYLECRFWGRPVSEWHWGFDLVLLVAAVLACLKAGALPIDSYLMTILWSSGISITALILVQGSYQIFFKKI